MTVLLPITAADQFCHWLADQTGVQPSMQDGCGIMNELPNLLQG